MDAPACRPNILHLGGVTLRDFVPIEDVFDDKVLADLGGAAPAPDDAAPFDRIPALFTSVADWPHATNLRCWACTFTFDGPPCFAPTFVRVGDGGDEVGVEGNFCTFNCAARYIDDTYPPQAFPDKHWRMRDNLCLVYLRFKGVRVRHIKPAPRKTELASFGGDLGEDEFWARQRELDPQFGLRDHRPCTTVPDRLRFAGPTVWEVCRAKSPAAPPPGANLSLADLRPSPSSALPSRAALVDEFVKDKFVIDAAPAPANTAAPPVADSSSASSPSPPVADLSPPSPPSDAWIDDLLDGLYRL